MWKPLVSRLKEKCKNGKTRLGARGLLQLRVNSLLIREMRRLVRGSIVSVLIAACLAPTAAAGDIAQDQRGSVLYEQYCQPCHGGDRSGYAADNAPSLISPTFRNTADDAFLRAAIDRGRAGTAMAGYGQRFGGPLTPVDIDALIAYLRGGTAPTPLVRRRPSGNAANGEQVYQTHCQNCHGTSEQRGRAVHLANPMFLETASDAFLRTAIQEGRPGTSMEAWHTKLSPDEIEDVIVYIRSLARPVPPPPALADGGLPPIPEGPVVINTDGAPADFTLREDRYISVADLFKAYEAQRRLVIIDARPASDYLRLHIAGAISVPHFQLQGLDKVPNDGTWVVAYCACPHHLSGVIFDELRKRGYAHTAILDEGIFAWQQAGHPVIAAPGQLPVPAPPSSAAAKSPS
jgi:cbb3-type cytochrome c oxidase subunit III